MDEKAEKIKLIILDVDGTLTDGKIYIDNNGIEGKAFNVKDGFAIAQAIKFGIKFAIITGRSSKLVEKRAQELKIEDIYQGVNNKLEKLDQLCKKYNLNYGEIAYMGDDINDLPVLKRAGLKAVPNDAVREVKEIADFISCFSGGKGAVRELIEYILRKKNIWKDVVSSYDI